MDKFEENMNKKMEELSLHLGKFLNKHNILYDLVYNPTESLFLKKGLERGCKIKNGLEMLQIQADESWKIWNS